MTQGPGLPRTVQRMMGAGDQWEGRSSHPETRDQSEQSCGAQLDFCSETANITSPLCRHHVAAAGPPAGPGRPPRHGPRAAHRAVPLLRTHAGLRLGEGDSLLRYPDPDSPHVSSPSSPPACGTSRRSSAPGPSASPTSSRQTPSGSSPSSR